MRASDLLQRKVSVAAILIVIIAFSAGIAVWSYTTHLASQAYFTVTSSVVSSVSITVTSTYSPVTSSPTFVSATSAEWLPTSNQVIQYTEASNYVGQSVTVEGIIVYTYSSDTMTTFLDFHYPYQGYFYAVIFVGDLSNFRFQPSSFYLNKDVRVTGTIQLYKGTPELIVWSPSQIEVAYMGFNYP